MSDIENKRKEVLLEGIEDMRKRVETGEVRTIVYVTEYEDGEICTSWYGAEMPGRLMVMAQTLFVDVLDNLFSMKFEILEHWNPDLFASEIYPSIDPRKKAKVQSLKDKGHGNEKV